MAIDFYFDFASPYGFIAAMQIEAKERAVRWRPFLLGAVYRTFGQSPLDHPLKRKYVIEVDAPRMARRTSLELKIPANFPEHSLPPSRAFYWIERHDPARRSRSLKRSIVGIGWTALLPAMPPWWPMWLPPSASIETQCWWACKTPPQSPV
jgi:2-hydroxychromene-2-carboxylate isomerase